VSTAKTETTRDRENGASRRSDGRLDIRLSIAGSEQIGIYPEQLFAAGWSASFESSKKSRLLQGLVRARP
jgi:lipoyl-dependent peroxiredoxin